MWGTVLLWLLVATVLLEIITCAARFGFRLRSRSWVRIYSKYTLGIRVHHGYFGVALLPALFFFPIDSKEGAGIAAFAGGLILSDLIHHLVVLPLLTGEMD